MTKDAKVRQQTFEQLYALLEEKVAKLEAGGLPLDDAIALYEEGMHLARSCQERLDQAEQRITKLRETFAPLERTNGAVNEPSSDYEYVSGDEDRLAEEQDDF